MILRSSRSLDFHLYSCIYSRRSTRCFSSKNFAEPLRILFCGSDEFSITSLKAVHEVHEQDKTVIDSVDVVCRPPKRVGRGLKKIREVAIAEEAKRLSLPLHEIDTFTGWTPPIPHGSPINLIIAVSFGRLVPPRILNGAKYGGLNVHPSMLPDFHGPAPLHHTLLTKTKRTGVTLQTMHPQHFDQGLILDQTPFPGVGYESGTVTGLSSEMAPLGAEMLVRAIQNRSFVAPYKDRGWKQGGHEGLVRHAPKITPEDSHIDWSTWTAFDILHKKNIIGPLWNVAGGLARKASRERRIIWSEGFYRCGTLRSQERWNSRKPGEPYFLLGPENKLITYINTCDGAMLVARKVKLDGEVERDSKPALLSLVVGNAIAHTGISNFIGSEQMLHFA